jgi:hypothetical protein
VIKSKRMGWEKHAVRMHTKVESDTLKKPTEKKLGINWKITLEGILIKKEDMWV